MISTIPGGWGVVRKKKERKKFTPLSIQFLEKKMPLKKGEKLRKKQQRRLERMDALRREGKVEGKGRATCNPHFLQGCNGCSHPLRSAKKKKKKSQGCKNASPIIGGTQALKREKK